MLITAQMRIGSFLGFGGVSVIVLKFCKTVFEPQRLVIFQQHRPGPPLPKGESYLTIGWKQVSPFQFLIPSSSQSLSDFGSV
jgi:hypothetical protein